MQQQHGFGLKVSGETLILGSSQLFAADPVISPVFTVLSLMAHVRTWLRPALTSRHASRSSAPSQGIAHDLFTSAEARAGLDPHQAEELRSAARAYLSVVR